MLHKMVSGFIAFLSASPRTKSFSSWKVRMKASVILWSSMCIELSNVISVQGQSVLVCKKKREGCRGERVPSVKGRAFPQGSMVAIETAPFVCTYSEQLLPSGFWWQGYYEGN